MLNSNSSPLSVLVNIPTLHASKVDNIAHEVDLQWVEIIMKFVYGGKEKFFLNRSGLSEQGDEHELQWSSLIDYNL